MSMFDVLLIVGILIVVLILTEVLIRALGYWSESVESLGLDRIEYGGK